VKEKTKEMAAESKGAAKNGEKPGGPLKGKLFKQGASGMKKVAERIFVLDGTTLHYYKN